MSWLRYPYSPPEPPEPPVDIRKPVFRGCADANHVRSSDIPWQPCPVCSHVHGPWDPFCPICAIEKLREKIG